MDRLLYFLLPDAAARAQYRDVMRTLGTPDSP